MAYKFLMIPKSRYTQIMGDDTTTKNDSLKLYDIKSF